MPKPLPARIRAYAPPDEKQVRFMVGQAQMEALAYANNRSTVFFSHRAVIARSNRPEPILSFFFYSVLSSRDSCHMDRRVLHVRAVHELVAKC
jgi:hypothetical protein